MGVTGGSPLGFDVGARGAGGTLKGLDLGVRGMRVRLRRSLPFSPPAPVPPLCPPRLPAPDDPLPSPGLLFVKPGCIAWVLSGWEHAGAEAYLQRSLGACAT